MRKILTVAGWVLLAVAGVVVGSITLFLVLDVYDGESFDEIMDGIPQIKDDLRKGKLL